MSELLIRGASQLWRRPQWILWVLLLGVVGVPLLILLGMSFNTGNPADMIPQEVGLDNYARLPDLAGPLLTTFEIAFGVMLLSSILGSGLAWIMTRTPIRGKRLLTFLIIVSYPMGPMVTALAWVSLGSPHGGLLNAVWGLITQGHLAQEGPFSTYNLPGIIVVQSLYQVPVSFMLIQSALQNMDSSLEEASDILGSSRISTAFRVTFPLMLPAIVGAALFSFVSALGAFAVPAVLGANSHVRFVTYEVYTLVGGYPADYPLAAVLGVLLIIVSAVTVFAANRVLRRRTYAVVGGRIARRRPADLGRWRYLATTLVYVYIVIAVVLPVAALIIASLQHSNSLDITHLTWSLHNYTYAIVEYRATRISITNSMIAGVATGVVGIIFAAAIALTVERARRAGRSSGGLEQLAMAPQAVPRLIFTVPLLVLILASPIVIYGTVSAIVIAYVIVFLPLAYRSIAAVAAQAHPSLEEAARVLGASGPRTTLSITVPMLRTGLISGATLLFMVSFSELGASLLLITTDSRVLAPAMFNFYDSGGIPLVSALAMIQTIIVGAALALISRLGGRIM